MLYLYGIEHSLAFREPKRYRINIYKDQFKNQILSNFTRQFIKNKTYKNKSLKVKKRFGSFAFISSYYNLTMSSLVVLYASNSLPPPGYQIHIFCDVTYLLLIFRVYLLMFCDVTYLLLIFRVYLLMFCDVTFALIFCDVTYLLLIFRVYLLMFCDVTFHLCFVTSPIYYLFFVFIY